MNKKLVPISNGILRAQKLLREWKSFVCVWCFFVRVKSFCKKKKEKSINIFWKSSRSSSIKPRGIGIVWTQKLHLKTSFYIWKITNKNYQFFDLYQTVIKLSFYILLKLLNTWLTQFCAITKQLIYTRISLYYSHYPNFMLTLSYRRLLPNLTLLLINQEWFYFFFFIFCHAPIPLSYWTSCYRQ